MKRIRVFKWLWLLIVLSNCYYPVYQPYPVGEPKAQGSTEPRSEPVLTSGEGVEVLAEGVAAITSTVDIARDQALKDALRKAVEQAVGSFINSETRVENFQLLSDRIYANSEGYVSSYRVLTESREGDMYRVVVRAVVKQERIENDLQAIGILIAEQGMPRVMVVVSGGHNPDDGVSVETKIISRLAEKGFLVVDPQTVARNIGAEQLRRLVEGDTQAALFAGMRTGAEVGILGRLNLTEEMKTVGYSQGMNRFFKVMLDLRIIDLQTAEVLGGYSAETAVPFSKAGALENAAEDASQAIIDKVLTRWKRRTNVTQIYCLNASYEKVQRLRSELRTKLRGVREVVTRELIGNTALIEVVSETATPEVLEQLGTRGIAVGFEIKNWTANRIEIKFTE